MMKRINLITELWEDYELLDSGEGRKLERYGAVTLIRPETQALWKPSRPEFWQKAQGEFLWAEGRGRWRGKDIPPAWEITWENVRCTVRPTSFKHTGVFPEQAPNWKWIEERVASLHHPQMLNLFGYTGIASIVAAQVGAIVTHVDASKQSNVWAKENAGHSGVIEGQIRYLVDDALKFAERETRRGMKYEGIVLDPPAFGRGPKGEVWKIEEHLPRLLEVTSAILAHTPGSFCLLNGYAAGYSSQSFLQAVEGCFDEMRGEFGELSIKESHSDRGIPSGIYVRFVR